MGDIQTVVARRPSSRSIIWAAAIVIVVVALCVALVLMMKMFSDTVRDVFKPQVNTREVISSQVQKMASKQDLITSQLDVMAEVERSETYKWWVIYFGTTTAKVRAPARVQYIVPLRGFGTSNIRVDTEKKIVTVIVPHPRLNDGVVEVDFTKMEVYASSAWSRFNKSEVTEEAKKSLRQAAVDEGGRDFLQAKAREDARAAIRGLLDPLAESLAPGVRLDIDFE